MGDRPHPRPAWLLLAVGLAVIAVPPDLRAQQPTKARRAERVASSKPTAQVPERSLAESRRCPRFSAGEALVKCDGEWTWANYMHPTPEAPFDCPNVWHLANTFYATLDAAIEARGCEQGCVYQRAGIACGERCGRGHWEVTMRPMKRPGKGRRSCPPLYQVSDGFYESLVDWAKAHPCPDAGAPPSK